MNLNDLLEPIELDTIHHLRINLSLPLLDRLSYEDHLGELYWYRQYEFARTLLEQVHIRLGIFPPDPIELLLDTEDLSESPLTEARLGRNQEEKGDTLLVSP